MPIELLNPDKPIEVCGVRITLLDDRPVRIRIEPVIVRPPVKPADLHSIGPPG